jgi:hypothetical protein
MICDSPYNLECANDCGPVPFPFLSPYTGFYFILWEYEGVTYQKQIEGTINTPLVFNWPFQTYGVFIFKIKDQFGNVLTFDGYDCFRVVGIPEYEIDPEELDDLLTFCENQFDADIQLMGRGEISISVEVDPPIGDNDLQVDLHGRGMIEIANINVEDPPDPPDEILEADLHGKGELELNHVVLGDPPGFAYLLNGEDLVMWAFSFRKLLPGQTNDVCCLAQRHSDGATQIIGFSGGWRDDVKLAEFAKGENVGLRTWFNAVSGAGLFQLDMAQQPLIAVAGVPVKYTWIGGSFPAAQLTGVRNMSVNAGTWNGTEHSWHTVIRNDDTEYDQGFRFGSTEYWGRAAGSGNNSSGVGTPVGYVNGGTLPGMSAAIYQAFTANQFHHTWFDDCDFSSLPSGAIGTNGAIEHEGKLIEWVVFNEDKASERTIREGLTLPVFGL